MRRSVGGDGAAVAGVVLYREQASVLCYAGVFEKAAVQYGAFSDSVSLEVSSFVAVGEEACCAAVDWLSTSGCKDKRGCISFT